MPIGRYANTRHAHLHATVAGIRIGLGAGGRRCEQAVRRPGNGAQARAALNPSLMLSSQRSTARTSGNRHRAMVAPVADLHRVAVHLVHHGEPVLVGDVVADEHGRASDERRLVHEGADRFALVRSRRPELHDVLPELDRVFVPELFAERSHGVEHVRLQLRRGAIVQRERAALVLHQQAVEGVARRRSVDVARCSSPSRRSRPPSTHRRRRVAPVRADRRSAAARRRRADRRRRSIVR